MSIYKACDIRGVYGEDLTDELMYRIGRAMATILRQVVGERNPSVLVGGDVRPSTLPLKESLTRGLIESGARILDVGILPTPAFYEAFHQLNSHGCAMVTASHNPAEFNGLKLCFRHRPVTPEEIEALSKLAETGPFVDARGMVEKVYFLPRYREFIMSHFPWPVHLKVAVDAGNGCYSDIAPEIMKSLGFEVVPLFCEVDGRFPNRSPNPAYIPLTELCEVVRNEKADYGVAFDGDGDRVIFVDDAGRRVVIDKAIVLLAGHVLRAESAAARGVMKSVYEVNCSQIVPEEMERCGAVPLMEKAGHAFMKARMIDEEAVFGGEVSGHFFYRALHGGDDGLYSAIQVGCMLQEQHATLADLVDQIPTYCTSPVIRMECKEGFSKRAVEEILASAGPPAYSGQADVSTVDGVRIQYHDGWGLARPSITEPVLSMRFEAFDAANLTNVVRRFLSPVPDVLQFALEKIQEWEAAGKPL